MEPVSSQRILRDSEIALRPPRQKDAWDRLLLGRDPEIVRMFGGDTSTSLPPLTLQEVYQWLGCIDGNPYAWVVEHRGGLLGEVRLDAVSEHAERRRLAIGLYNPAKLGQGIGRRVIRLVLQYAFEELLLYRVDLRVLEYNTRARRCYRSCGFIEEARECRAAVIAGEPFDDIIMRILSHEYYRKRPPASRRLEPNV